MIVNGAKIYNLNAFFTTDRSVDFKCLKWGTKLYVKSSTDSSLLIVQDNAKPHTGPLLWTIPYHNLIVSEGSIEKKNWTNKNNNLS